VGRHSRSGHADGLSVDGSVQVNHAPPGTGDERMAPGLPSRPGGTTIVRSTALLAALAAASGLLGFGRDTVIAAVFGASAAVDAYLVAQGLMNLVLALVADAVAKAVVPPVARAVIEGDPQRSNRTVSTTLTVAAAALVPASALMALNAELVISLLAPGFEPEVAAQAARLTQIMLLATMLVAGTDILAAVCQAHGRFFFSGLQGIPFNLAMIIFTAALGARWGADALAAGFVVGSAFRLAVQLPAVRAVRLSLRPSVRVRDPGFREVLRLMPALLVGTALVNVNTLVDRAVGSGQVEGTITALNLGWRLVTLAYTLLVVTLVAALYPALSALAAPERRGELRRLTGQSLGGLLVVLAPVVAVLLAVTQPLVRVVFGRGEFGDTAVRMTSTAIAFFAVALLGIAVGEVASRTYYALGDTRTPVAFAVLGMTINVIGDLTVGRAFGLPGIAASTTASFLFVAVGQVVALHVRHDAVDLRALLPRALRSTLAAVGVVASLTALVRIWPEPAGGWSSNAVLLAVAMAIGGGVYVAVLALLNGPELGEARLLGTRLIGRLRS